LESPTSETSLGKEQQHKIIVEKVKTGTKHYPGKLIRGKKKKDRKWGGGERISVHKHGNVKWD